MWQDKIFIQTIINESTNKSEVLKKLNLKVFTGNYDTLNRYIEKYKIDISHFNFKRNNNIFHKKIPLKEILIEKSTYQRSHLKERLYKEGLKEKKCELCGQDEMWNGKKMSLILDHINGINNDNRIDNLRIVCPNCNATLDTHCGKNKVKKNKVYVKKNKKKYHCPKCNTLLSSKNSKMCLKCSNIKRRKVNRPNYEQLIKEIQELGYCAVGRKYGVSDNAIRKWIKK